MNLVLLKSGRCISAGVAVLLMAAASACLRAEDAPRPAGLRVFYTGHSFHMFVPARIDQLARSAGIEGHKLAGVQGIGGSRVIQHWELAAEKNKARPALESGQVDVFTMAAHLQIPDEGITRFVELGLRHNPKLRLLVQASWYPFDGPPPERRIRDNSERNDAKIADLQAAVDDWRKKMEKQVDELNAKHGVKAVGIVPVGDAVVKLRAAVVAGEYPGVTRQSDLFTDPIGHGGEHIQALTAYCNFVAIYGVNPMGLKIANSKLDEAQQAMLQRIAWETVSRYPYAGVKAAPSAP